MKNLVTLILQKLKTLKNFRDKLNKYLIIIAGPTAVGKTSLSIELAKKFNTQIVSADSRQFFKELQIGVAKPSIEELNLVKHYFIDSHSIHQEFNVGRYEEEAIACLKQLFKTNDLVILVGGSGLYIDAICKGFDKLPQGNDKIRKQLADLLKIKGIEFLQQKLKEVDPQYYNYVDLSNSQRLIRALEVSEITGKPYSTFRSGEKKERFFNYIKIALNIDREKLYETINERVDNMMSMGLFQEAKELYMFKNLNALKTVGYSELFEHLEGKISLNKAIELIKQNTRKYAKRQLTWLRRDKEYTWFNPNDETKIIKYIEEKTN